jgi:hypothetical protein
MVSVIYLKQLEGVVDAMIEAENDPLDIIEECKNAVIESLSARNKPIPEKIRHS